MYVHVEDSNVIRKGGVMDFDFLPIMAALTSWGFRFILDIVASIADGIWAAMEVLTGMDATSWFGYLGRWEFWNFSHS